MVGLGFVTAVAYFVAFGSIAGAQAAGQPKLTGQTWQLAKLGRIDRQRAGITAAFTTDGKLSGFSGCNSYNGTYTTSGSSITVSKIAVTQKACKRAVMAGEKAYLAALTAARTYSIAKGMLTLKTRRGRPLATFGVQSQSLAGSSWNVVEYNNGKQAVVSVLAGTRLTAIFDKGGHISGSAGCNEFNGPVKTTPPKIVVGPLSATRKSCSTPAGVMEQEAGYLAALSSAATYSIQGSTLQFRTAGGAIAASFSRAH